MFSKVKEYLDNLVSNERVPACDCIVYHGHDVVFRHMAGYSDIEKTKPVTSMDKYMLFSATKVVTVTAVMQLVDRGQLRLEDELYHYLPEFEHMYVGDIPAVNKITVEHLLSMQAGFGYDPSIPEIQKVIDENPMASTADIISGLAKAPLLFEPGTRFQYSFCHDVLGRLIEVISGMSYGEYIKKNIFEPLNMHDSGFSIEEAVPFLTQQYEVRGSSPAIPVPIGHESHLQLTPCFESGGAGMVSTVEDYGRFIDAMCNNGVSASGIRIISKESIDSIRINRLVGAAKEDFDKWGILGYGYGLGVRTLIDKETSSSKSPIGEFGWDGYAGAYVMIDVENNVGIFYAQQVCRKNMYQRHWKLRDLVYESLSI